MKKLAFFILLSLVTLGVSAQSNLKWNVNAGIGMSNWYGDDTDGTDAKFAYKVGIGLEVPFANTYNPQIQISAESETKRSIFRKRDKTKRSKKESAQHSKSRNKSFVMTSVSAL